MSLYSDLNEVLTPYANKIKALEEKTDLTDTTLDEFSESVNEDIDGLKDGLADVDNHTVKSAEQLISDKRTVDKLPYKYRASASGKSDRAYDVIVGGTVCFNQIAGNSASTAPTTTNGVTFTPNSDGTVTVNGTASEQTTYNYGVRVTGRLNHVRYICGCPDGGSSSTYRAKDGYGSTAVLNRIGAIDKPSNDYSVYQIVIASGYTANNLTFKPQIFDLTQMFGTTIADHIYSLEQATAGAGVALFRTMFQNDYYPYNAGSLISVEGLSAHVMRDADDNIIGSYPLDSTLTLRGVPVLKDGRIEFDGDTYSSDGTVTRRYGVVDLGTLTWKANGQADDSVYASVEGRQGGSTNLFISNGLKRVSSSTVAANMPYGSYKTHSTSTSIILRMTDLSVSNARTMLSGVYLVYELATPTTEEATPYTSPQIVSPYGTEEYISETVCPVGHITEYPDNLRAKIDGLPWDLSMIAPVETAYKATRNYTVNQLLIVDNTLYKVTANIANGGTITADTNVVATTLSEVISALA